MGYNGFVFLCVLLAVAVEVLVISSVEVTAARDLAGITSSNSNQKNTAAGHVHVDEQTNAGVEDYEGRGGWGGGRGEGPWEGGGGRGGGPWEGGGGPGGWGGGRGGEPWEGGGGRGGWGGGRGGGPWEGGGGRGGWGGGGGGCRWGCCGGGWRCRCCTYAEAFKNQN